MKVLCLDDIVVAVVVVAVALNVFVFVSYFVIVVVVVNSCSVYIVPRHLLRHPLFLSLLLKTTTL